MALLDKLKGALGDVRAQLRTLAADIETKRQRREFLLHAPVQYSEFVAYALKQLDLHAADLGPELAQHLQLTPGLGGWGLQPYHTPRSQTGILFSPRDGRLRETLLIAALLPALKTVLNQNMANARPGHWPADDKCGPPLDERRSELAALETELAALEERAESLRADVSSLLGE